MTTFVGGRGEPAAHSLVYRRARAVKGAACKSMQKDFERDREMRPRQSTNHAPK